MDQVLWAAGRASGVIALVLLTVSVILGIATRSGRPLPGLPRFSVLLIHRNISLISSLFVLLHIVTLLFDRYARLRLIDFVLPFLGAFKPFWQGLGTVAFDLLLVVIVSSLLRHRLGVKTFRFLHWFTYAMWPVALAHAIGNGTNGTTGWFLILAGISVAAVFAAVIWRMSTRFIESSSQRQGTGL